MIVASACQVFLYTAAVSHHKEQGRQEEQQRLVFQTVFALLFSVEVGIRLAGKKVHEWDDTLMHKSDVWLGTISLLGTAMLMLW